ncbi:hypothetical protein ACP4OV_025002 [Aristida adscensionis]
MEAASVPGELELPPGFGFVPDDEQVIEHYLLPRLQGHRLPAGGLILEADPLSAPPWLLLEQHGRRGDAFFFASAQAKNRKGARRNRSCAGGGTWKGERKAFRVDQKLVVPAAGMEVAWQKYVLSFHEEGVDGSSGWVMHEYSITAPPDLAASPTRVYRIRESGHGKNARKRKRAPQGSVGVDDDDEANGSHGATRPRPSVAEAAALFVGKCTSASESQSSCVVEEDAMGGNPQDLGGEQGGAAQIAEPPATSLDQGLSLSELLDDSSPVLEVTDAEIQEFWVSLGDLDMPDWFSSSPRAGAADSCLQVEPD